MRTERLFLRPYEEKDRPHLIELFTDAEVMKHVGGGVMTEDKAGQWWRKLFEKFYPQGLNIWAVFALEDGRYVGHAGIYRRPTREQDWEFVYFLRRAEWGKGYATEIARKIVDFGFEDLGLEEIFATVDDDHYGSIKVIEKAGLSFSHHEFDDEGRFSVYSIKAPKKSER
jgi:RimJ/RimL family protein N-acetyltransferase